ncbi:hypothetical protein GCM10023068_01050 [Leifsonia shinshuensis]
MVREQIGGDRQLRDELSRSQIAEHEKVHDSQTQGIRQSRVQRGSRLQRISPSVHYLNVD